MMVAQLMTIFMSCFEGSHPSRLMHSKLGSRYPTPNTEQENVSAPLNKNKNIKQDHESQTEQLWGPSSD